MDLHFYSVIYFLKRIDGETPVGLDLHLIVDNYGTHKHPRVKSWLKRHPRFNLYFISHARKPQAFKPGDEWPTLSPGGRGLG